MALLYSAVAGLAAGCEKKIVDPVRAEVDFGDPKAVTAALFWAAAHDDDTHLASLCDPRGENDTDTDRVCALTRRSSDWPAFREAFARGRLDGEPRVHGDHAAIYFVFGPRVDQSETMELVRRDGRWYLWGF
ncbi:MAG TPA: hypothetical protein VMZ28_28780 [Kofleriaceae bacterium]|nr:hypothetical protein [Kofleriaceae bacterium]